MLKSAQEYDTRIIYLRTIYKRIKYSEIQYHDAVDRYLKGNNDYNAWPGDCYLFSRT